ncbi:hypothetical protein LB533_13680 [Mesorhizobium sp. BR1-1-13]|uniref:hypothetical protein n=1 Tax=Mesorhizobium sp. BR1-1-13 TaxID=2876656 RepID=UPI001CD124E2|nr:hypothetical protein [Mesorhizobium sp. BR1-1-13]MBZ9942154.1 hypothetical protein [Mesorhizobium sp. BR1-1-13]
MRDLLKNIDVDLVIEIDNSLDGPKQSCCSLNGSRGDCNPQAILDEEKIIAIWSSQ